HTRAEVYPVALVIDGTQAKTTWHLQRELTSLLEAQGEEAWPRESCLGAYLTQQALPAKVEAQRALFDVPALTASQRQAAEQFWGSRLTAVQGPPGTGKTTLILHLCAEALVRQVDHLLDHQTMGSALLLITSGNNRAVDNVLDPLSAGDGLPLALRVGSRQVCEQALCTRLRATAGWLERAQREPAPERARELEAALASFARERAELDLLLTPRRRALVLAAERERVRRALAALPAASRRKRGDASELPPSTARLLDEALAPLERRLLALSELCGAKPGLAQVNAIARHYEKTARRELPTLEAALLAADLQLEVPLPPLEAPLDARALMEAWEEGAETFLGQLSPIRERVQQSLRRDQRAQQEDELRRQLEALGPESDKAIPEAGGHDERSRALFSAALRVREAWAKEHAATLLESVSAALRIVEQERSLRPVFRDEPEHARQLCRLFGTWGSTLLSLGNCLPAEADSIARVVIDEAGQCHPAHAVSALLRSTAAMVIGDVHQLAPVIDLTLDDDARLLRSCRLRLDERALAPYRVSSDSQVSAQSVADRAVTRKLRLIDHFRCRPEIIAISDALCGYGLQVRTPARVGMDLLQHPVSLLDLKGEQQSLFGSLSNELELQETLRLVEVLLGRGAAPAELAVITPYRGQLERLRRGLLERGIPLELSPELLDGDGPTPHAAAGLALGTVHRFQGGERSIVLFSSVVTRSSSLGFLNARPNLLNVAISRARHHFVCLGHRSVLLQGDVTRVLAEAAWPLS
ncbi:MAG: hypothetical protein JWN48_1125, partial [Myxococcaceae bacterium]|nr:hypothetical protein [Myxococcaceae bacterium]